MVTENEGKDKVRELGVFDSVIFDCFGTLRIVQDDTHKLEIDASENVVRDLVSEIQDDTLVLRDSDNIFTRLFKGDEKRTYTLHVKELRSLVLAAACNVECSSLKSDAFDISGGGAAKIRMLGMEVVGLKLKFSGAVKCSLGGSSGSMDLNLSGAGDINAKELKSGRVRVAISGAGKVKLAEVEELEVVISGAGKVTYREAKTVRKTITGFGSVTKNEE